MLEFSGERVRGCGIVSYPPVGARPTDKDLRRVRQFVRGTGFLPVVRSLECSCPPRHFPENAD